MTQIRLVVVALVATFLASTAQPAGACSFAPPTLDIVGEPTAGDELRIAGEKWFYAPDGVGDMCQGTIIAMDPVTVVVEFSTLSGPRSVALVAPVTVTEATPDSGRTFTISARMSIPPDATRVQVEATGNFGFRATAQASIDGAVATTVPTTAVPTTAPAPGAAAAPANAVAGSPSFTG